ncbi:hypothetical protein N7539_006054 [Penicillium diatomitis]|uniref:Uncharacterized protein n=1 Tax=Penicillium diatomitis TaxID=2819901 RepID=A0A9W9X4T3_9EURO|nr:uncharacterized protein N7539_006054 [Penicillium diatomitis]KAJ5483854.1 hypothetical protein N7539_006054 [Penicillium diatomitis]
MAEREDSDMASSGVVESAEVEMAPIDEGEKEEDPGFVPEEGEMAPVLQEEEDEDPGFVSWAGERHPQVLGPQGFRPVWSNVDGYPGEIPSDILEWVGPENPTAADHLRMVGPISSLLWLARFDDLARTMLSPEYATWNEVMVVPSSATIRSLLPDLAAEERIPSSVYQRYTEYPPALTPVASDSPDLSIPSCVTTATKSFSLLSLFPLTADRNLPDKILSVRISFDKPDKLAQRIERDLIQTLGKGLLFSGTKRSFLELQMKWFVPVLNASNTDNEFGPGIYTTSSLAHALFYAGPQGVLLVFKSPDFQDVNIWEPDDNDWRTIVDHWTGRRAATQKPLGWESDVTKGPISVARRRSSTSIRDRGPHTQVVATAYPGAAALARSLCMVIWIE